MSDLVAAPAFLVPATAIGALYLRGWRRRRSSPDPVARGAATTGELWRFVGGLVVAALAVAPIVEQLAHRSFAGHMLQHLLLVLVAAPLLGTTRPVTTLGLAIAPGAVERTRRRLSSHWLGPFVLIAGALHLATRVSWHLPPLYDAAIASVTLHRLEHASLLGTAVLAWTAVVATARSGDARVLVGVVVLALNALAGAGLGVVLLSAPLVLYDSYAALGPEALDAQRVGGAMMKVGSVVVHAGAAVWIATAWLSRSEHDEGSVDPRPSRALGLHHPTSRNPTHDNPAGAR